jgi:putative restriction endonuclease
MAKAVFTTKVTPSYDDLPESRYHFPTAYLQRARAAVGDHIIYYEPRRSTAEDSSRGGRQAYFATARVAAVIEDTQESGHFYALISDYLDFDRPVPFAENGDYFESALKKADGSTNKGAFGHAVRLLPDAEFDRILRAGFVPDRLFDQPEDLNAPVGFDDVVTNFERPIVELTVFRPFRDQAFKRSVRAAYENRCALTGLRLINGGGRPEVQAAHIKPVASNGPDSVRNGLALSGTIHWLFDRGLISVDDDYRILVAENHVPKEVIGLLNQDRRINAPSDPQLWPHPHFLKFHREKVFKG